MDRIREQIQANIKYLRQKHDLSQTELSQQSNFCRTYIGQIERGDKDPSLESLVRIANALSLPFLKFFEEIPLHVIDGE